MKKVLKRVFIALFLFLIISFVIAYIITSKEMSKSFGRGDYPDRNKAATWFYDHYENEYPREEVSFKSGDNTLKGYIYGMDNNKGLIVFAHGIGSGHEMYLSLITRLVDCGWRVFAYDATGSGYSEGEGTKGLAQSVLDLDNALTYAESDARLNILDKFVLGHSWGGYAAAAVLNFDHDVKADITMSGYNTPFEELSETCGVRYGFWGKLLDPVVWLYNKMEFGSNSSISAVDGINKSGIPVLVLHGNDDDVIGYDGASVIAHKSEITNPNVEYKVFDEEGRNGHNSYFYTPEYKKYKEEVINPKREELEEKYGDDIPDDEYIKFVDMIVKELYNGTNDELVELIDEFFSKNL
ncbi:Alpha/beta hydrolase family protein [Ruminococcus flavefaciens]|uniref:Alpha/beta hydrolase family protein n=1 Tax=Ruminococcus flavefaciens TaxID=1265 RepID=A0A1H6I174_RUMFL|nr:alpha/beta fold hydrolase [Ruminococcus flavefaciens]SEH42464.1 Alpha/beta hydrolase family protein [Ruminococcus flavefaciens]